VVIAAQCTATFLRLLTASSTILKHDCYTNTDVVIDSLQLSEIDFIHTKLECFRLWRLALSMIGITSSDIYLYCDLISIKNAVHEQALNAMPYLI
jgi:hypothetical protein